MCVLIFSTSFVQNISHSKKKWVWYDKKIYVGLHVKYSLFSSDFNETCIFLSDFRKILKQAKLFHADGWTEGQPWWS